MSPTLVTTIDIDPIMRDRIAVNSDYRVKDKIKAVPGAKWSAEHRRWTVPLNWPSCLALRAELGLDLRMSDEVREWALEQRAVKDELLELRNQVELKPEHPLYSDVHDPELDDQPGFDTLYPFQWIGSRIIQLAGDYVLFDETGTGKSRTALAGLARIAELDEDEIFPLVIVAPKSMLPTWRVEVLRFFPEAAVSVVKGTPAKVRDALDPEGYHVYVMSYDTLRRYSRLASFPTVSLTDDEKRDKELQAIKPRSIIVDEVQRIISPKSKQTRAAWHVAAGCKYRVGLTGTPIQDTPEDLWSIMHGLVPSEYGTKTSYVDRYLHVDYDRFGVRQIEGLHPTNRDEFLRNLDTRTRRTTKAVALPWLPEKVFELRWVELPAKMRRAYNDMRDKYVAELESGEVLTADSVLEKAGRLLQLANASGTFTPSGNYKMELPSPKLDAFMEDVKEGDFDTASVVVFTDSRQLAELAAEALRTAKKTVDMITGSVTGDAREEAKERFQRGDVQYLVLTRAGGEGITLTRASVMVRLFRSWSGITHAQVEDRVHRIGSEVHDSIKYVDYVTEDTVEEQQLVRLNAKGARAQEVLRDEELLDMLRGKGARLI